MTAPLLAVRGVNTYYGNIAALKGVDLEVGDGEIVALIGANGAGKSTLMMTIFGNPRAREGSITFAGRDITHLPTHEIARLKIAQSPEGRRIFVRMTRAGKPADGRGDRRPRPFRGRSRARVRAVSRACKERIDQRGGTLSGGEQQMLAIARALMSRPRLLLLDEPSLGLAPLIARQIFDAIRKLNAEEKLTVFLVEQNAFHALKLAHRGYVMVNGRITLIGQRPRAAGTAGGASGLSRRRKALDGLSMDIPEFVSDEHSLGVFFLVSVAPRRRRRLARRPRDRGDLAAVVARRALHAASQPRRALPPFRAVRRQVLVAALLSRRLRGLPGVRLSRLPADAGRPDGHPLQLDQRARGPASAGAAATHTTAGSTPKSG